MAQDIQKLDIQAVEQGAAAPKTVIVYSVENKGIASRMGIKKDDVILRVNDKKITSVSDLKAALKTQSATVKWRSGMKFYQSTARWVSSTNPDVGAVLEVGQKEETKEP
jgi:S1-C subfamily serine protease